MLQRSGERPGVEAGSGEEIHADSILSSLDAHRTFLGLLESGTLEPAFEEEVRRFKFRGSSGKVNLAVDRLPDFSSLPGVGEHLRGAISFSPSIDEMETAYDDAKYGQFSRKPYIDMIIPTLVAIALLATDAFGFGALMGLEHVAMLLGMLVAMLLRLDEYTSHVHHTRNAIAA